MTIPLEKEPDDFEEKCFGVIERCVFCNTRSKYWHVRTNNCVCQSCAKTHKVGELTNWKKPKRKKI